MSLLTHEVCRYQLGEHSEWAKHTNFELATHVPLVSRTINRHVEKTG